MLDVTILEKRWLEYKLKSYLPHLIILVSLFVLTLVLFLLFSQSKDTAPQEELKDKKVEVAIPKKQNISEVSSTPKEDIAIQSVEKEQIHISSQPNVSVNVPKKQVLSTRTNDVVLEPSFSFIKSINRDAVPYSAKKENSRSEVVQQNSRSQYKNNQETVETSEAIAIQKGTAHGDIEHVLQRFKKNNNPALSLFIAQKYYDQGDFQNAYNYALVTNELDNNMEDGWLIFTKSLMKIGQKEKAIQTLKQYIEYSNSQKANLLLENILSGKFQ